MRIFINYRREISRDIADRIDERLVKHFGRESVFKDVHSIQPGQDFPTIITTEVGRCDVLLAVIGPRWASVTDDHGQKRFESREDFVRLELETALERKIRIIPLLSDDAHMPRKEELPETLQKVVSINALQIRPDPDFNGDMARLLKTLHRGWIAALFKPSSSGSILRPWIAGAAILTIGIGLVFGLAMIWAKTPIKNPRPPVPTDQGPSQPQPTSTRPPQPPPTEYNPDKCEPPLTPLTSPDDLKKVEEQIECGDQAKAHELLRQLKSRCADDPVLSYYDAVAAALAAGNWGGEPEALISSGRKLEAKEGPASNRGRLDAMLKCLLLYLKQEDKARFQHLLGRSIESRSPDRHEDTSPPTVLDHYEPKVAPLASADDLKKVEEQIQCGDHAKAHELLRELKSRCADDPVLSYYDAVAAALAAGNWGGEPEALISSGRKLEAKEGPASNRGRLDPMLKCLLPYLKQEDKARFQHLLGRSIE